MAALLTASDASRSSIQQALLVIRFDRAKWNTRVRCGRAKWNTWGRRVSHQAGRRQFTGRVAMQMSFDLVLCLSHNSLYAGLSRSGLKG
jgi:hypothetical protein